ncbi:hypothetical protein VE04_10131, partial [Pseudogymnoascus sp. 24MN13]
MRTLAILTAADAAVGVGALPEENGGQIVIAGGGARGRERAGGQEVDGEVFAYYRDEQIPRTAAEITDANTELADAFREAFADKGVPVVPTLGNNDILPHNILLGGPNKWLQTYGRVWHHFIPEVQRHGFQRGGWFTVEVIPGRLAVVSLNTLYFFERNSGVDGCASKSEPGWEQMEWLGIQLGFMRDRGVKAILMGHVPPARTGGKKLWDESCWGR